MKKILALLFCLLAAPAFAQTTLPWGNTGGSGGSAQMRDTAGTWITLGTINNTAHTFSVALGVLPTIPLTQLATQAANTVVANFTGSTASPVAFAMPACAAPSFLGYTAGTGIVCNAIGTNNVTLTNLAQIAANTLLGNTTSGTANVTAVSIPACATALQYTSGTGFACAAAVVTTANGQLAITGGNTVYSNQTPSSFRLTIATGTPVVSLGGGAATQGTIFLTPYTGNLITLWNTTINGFSATVCPEMSNVLANSSVGNAGPAAVVASAVYDLFAWNSGTLTSPTCTLTRGPAWTTTNLRSAGTALSRTNGYLTNGVAITNGPGANQGLYVGTFESDGSGGTVSYTFGVAQSGGGAANLFIWNMYNRVMTPASVMDTGAAYTYTSNVVRQARASTGNQINTVVGLVEDAIQASYYARGNTVAAAAAIVDWAIGFNSTSSFACSDFTGQNNTAVINNFGGGVSCSLSPVLGQNQIFALEVGDNVNANTFDTTARNTLSATIRN